MQSDKRRGASTGQGKPLRRRPRIHAYAASFGEDLAADLIGRWTKEGDTLLDPFVGAGTAIAQARRLGRGAIGIDVDPVACLISRVLATRYTESEIDKMRCAMEHALNVIRAVLEEMEPARWEPGQEFSVGSLTAKIPERDEIAFWFAPSQRAVISSAVAVAKSQRSRKLRDLIGVSISAAIIRKWPNTISYAMDIDHSRPHRVIREDITVESQLRALERTFLRVLSIVHDVNTASSRRAPRAWVIQGDSSSILHQLQPCSVDYVLTSPPYFNAIDYPRSHRFVQWWLWPSAERLSRQDYVGLKAGGAWGSAIDGSKLRVPESVSKIDQLAEKDPPLYRALCKYICDLGTIVDGIFWALKPGRPLTFVVANNSVRRVTVPVVDFISELLSRSGFVDVHVEERRMSSARRRYPYGLKGFRGLMHTEYTITAMKQGRRQPPNSPTPAPVLA